MLGMFVTFVLFSYVDTVGAKFSFGLFSSRCQVCGTERINIIIYFPVVILYKYRYRNITCGILLTGIAIVSPVSQSCIWR